MQSLLLAFRSSIDKLARSQDNELPVTWINSCLLFRNLADVPQSKLIEPLSQRELEVLRLIAQGLSNAEISQRLFLAMSTVKGHNCEFLANYSRKPHRSDSRAPRVGLVVIPKTILSNNTFVSKRQYHIDGIFPVH